MDFGSDLRQLFVKLNKVRMTMVYSELKALGITGPQLFVLRELFMGEPRTIGDLSRAVELSNSTVTGIVDRLERAKLVERHRDEKDRRVVWIRPTASCMHMKSELFDKFQADFYEELQQSFTPEQFALLKDMLEKLIEYLEKKLEGTK
ncbi:MarR family winged helix-turn-helix transcriptional regulator [Gordoniibacillus kamchatkensis]|uniref:MarR family winged helix-turn-helix transcriptional regulator n=1 Tax=Gordoniibacillus kamchatkensis TaxID=1590651 RepID=UPI000695C9BC|nr:MarR family transcriptional regulator [Paenibacillus sp. VKM B-2647]